MYKYFYFLLFILFSCDFQKDITVNLPSYDGKLVVECYLESGKPYRLALSESVPYLSAPTLPDVPDARVIIRYKGVNDTLLYRPAIDSVSRKIYNYSSRKLANYDTLNDYELIIQDKKGRSVTSKTRFLGKVNIDSIQTSFNNTKDAVLLVRFKDNPQKEDFYRISFHKKRLTNSPTRDFHFNDILFASETSGIGSGFQFKEKDSVFVTLYHIEEGYYRFLRSTAAAARANANPFSEPAVILSNIDNGIGVFTTLTFDRKFMIVKK
ncbi:MAG: DUF4249 domain-containing protein [Bacteroidetes bacterium]|nr:MAG: DUF4249 domain-containing protein [Bacteroidota bacterium]